MNNINYIISIIKFKGKYRIYLPYIVPGSGLFEDKICEWWGNFDTFDECVDVLMEKNQYDHLEIDKNLLRQMKINNIKR